MESTKQEEIYLALFRHWKYEISQPGLVKIPNGDSFINNVRSLVIVIQAQLKEAKPPEIRMVYQKTLENIRYIINDLLELRTNKIMKLAKCLQKIDESILLPVEISYIQALTAAFKGYSKTKGAILEDIDNSIGSGFGKSSDNCSKIEPTLMYQKESTRIISDIETPPILANPNILTSEFISFASNNSNNDNKGAEITPKLPGDSNSIIHPPENAPLDLSDEQKRDMLKEKRANNCTPPNGSNFGPMNIKKGLQYFTIRALQSIPALVGEDLAIYGPLQREDVVRLPERNASILIDENLARYVK